MGKIMKDGQQYGVGGIQKAESITYDNTDSGMTATNVQGAVDELNNGLTILTFTGTIASFMTTYVSSQNLELNRVYSAKFQDPNWDSAYGWVMRIDTNSYVAELSNKNGYHIWVSNINGTFSQKAISYQ